MKRNFTLEYWLDNGWYVGRIKEVPGIFSQGETLKELEENIQDAYELMTVTEKSTIFMPIPKMADKHLFRGILK